MVTQLQPGPTIGQAAGQGLQAAILPGLQREMERMQTQRALGEIRNRGDQSPRDTLFSLIEAATLSPEIGRSLGPAFQTLMAEQNAKKSADVPITGSAGMNRPQQMQTSQPMQGGQVGSQGNLPTEQMQKFFPNNYQPNEAPGNLPQQATGGLVKPVLSGEELINESQNLLRKWNQAGIIGRTIEDALKVKEIENQGNIQYNQAIEQERINRIAEQEAFGEVGENALTNLLPDATDEQKALFRKKGEEAAGQGKSQADIKRILAKEATKFKNNISNIQNALNAPRIQNKLSREVLGNSKTLEQAEKDARTQVKPLINEGLFDTSRSLLSNAGFYPEEREQIIFGGVPEELKKSIDEVPKARTEIISKGVAGTPLGAYREKIYTPESIEDLKSNMANVWGQGKNDKINLIQMRKEYEDKGYDWRVFKDALNDLFGNGQIELNDDQTNQMNSYLNEPPLNLLEKFLYKLNLRGR